MSADLGQTARANREVLDEARLPRCIAIDLGLLLPNGENGGSWVMTAELVHQLSRLLPHWSFVLLTSETGHAVAAQLDAPNVRRVCIDRLQPPAPPGSWWHSFKARLPTWRKRTAQMQSGPGLLSRIELLRALRADMLFCPFGQFGMPTYQDPRIPTVSVIYDLQFLFYPEFFSEEQRAWRERTYTHVCERSDALVCISETTRGTVLETAAVEAHRVHTIYIRTGMGPGGTSSRQPSDVLKRLRLQPLRYFVYPANLWRHKNHEVLLAAVQELRRRDPGSDVKVVCTGAGLDRLQELRDFTVTLGVADAVVFPGYLPRWDLDTLLHNCCGLVYPSLYEGFGIPLLEMMRIGKPIACSNVTSLPEVGGDAVLTFDPLQPDAIADALQRLSSDPVLCAQLVQRGHQRAAMFGDSERMALEYLELFLRVLKGGPRHRVALFGVYGDGWTSDRVLAMLGPEAVDGELDLTFTLPAWAPTPCVELTLRSSRDLAATRVSLSVGASTTLKVPVSRAVGWVEVAVHPLFQPSADGRSQDVRALGAMCDSARLVTRDGIVDLPVTVIS